MHIKLNAPLNPEMKALMYLAWCYYIYIAYYSLGAIKLLVGFTYLGTCEQTKQVLAATQMRGAVALMDLCDYLMSAGDSEVGCLVYIMVRPKQLTELQLYVYMQLYDQTRKNSLPEIALQMIEMFENQCDPDVCGIPHIYIARACWGGWPIVY